MAISFRYRVFSGLLIWLRPTRTPMTLTQLKYIVTLADERHFGRAARKCCVSQSALSMAVRALELELELVLFERDSKGVRLTPAGEKVVAKARSALEHSNTIDRLAKGAVTPLSQPLRIGICESYAAYYLPQLASALKYKASTAALAFTEGALSQLTQQLLAGDLEVLVASHQTISGVTARAVSEEPLVAVLRQHDPLAQFASLPLAALTNENLWLPGGALRQDIIDGCAALLESVNRVTESQLGVHTLLQHISVAGGVSVIPRSLANAERLAADGLVARTFGEEFTRQNSLMWRSSFARPQDIDALAKEVVNLCARASWPQVHSASEALFVDNNCW